MPVEDLAVTGGRLRIAKNAEEGGALGGSEMQHVHVRRVPFH